MPGHKGVSFLGCEPLDITEIQGADSLYEAEGIIARSRDQCRCPVRQRPHPLLHRGLLSVHTAMLHLAVLAGGPKDGSGR